MVRQNPDNQSSGVTDLVGAIIADLRQHVVEEGWFGRVLTNGPEGSLTRDAQPTNHGIEM